MSSTLDRYKANVTSQHGEDGIVAYLLTAYPSIPHFCLEVGAGDGVALSNTHTLWSRRGWRALLIERDADHLSKRFGHLPSVSIVPESITALGPNSLDVIAKRLDFPREIGIASIDIDSFDYWVLAHLAYLKPAVILIEMNPRIPVGIDYCDPEGIVFLRHSADAVARLAAEKGYRVVACTGANAILVHEETIATNPGAVPNLPIEAVFDHAYAKRFSKIVVNSQYITDVPIYTRRPSLLMRCYGRARYAHRTMLDLINRRRLKPFHAVPPSLRTHIAQSGLWI